MICVCLTVDPGWFVKNPEIWDHYGLDCYTVIADVYNMPTIIEFC